MGLEIASVISYCSHSWKLLGWELYSTVTGGRNREEETQVCVDKAHLDSSISQPLNVLVIAMWDGPLMVLADLGSLFKKHGFSYSRYENC